MIRGGLASTGDDSPHTGTPSGNAWGGDRGHLHHLGGFTAAQRLPLRASPFSCVPRSVDQACVVAQGPSGLHTCAWPLGDRSCGVLLSPRGWSASWSPR